MMSLLSSRGKLSTMYTLSMVRMYMRIGWRTSERSEIRTDIRENKQSLEVRHIVDLDAPSLGKVR